MRRWRVLSDLQSYDNSMNCMLFVGLTVVAYQAILLFTQYSLREIPIIASSMVYQ
ncbi:hypothetical protein HMPREF9544_03804 [Escherichia coli MS 153-1]|uniref:Uncharacterized protein n=2 Tax=Escherichia coli TaxID=562 RepID=A0A0H2VC17_ECOL6|nr:Conserved hypothetical protein [Escherichia coli CFT073]ABE09451.1 conserved hypothetical protein [Escherichia coli UTI89]AER86499.1 hypothetical protein i02_3971 [Escherichia coli str. 'clone D i2']AER91418.1 hypothetical protein i14_3971 [Escherichia coli str. 'clone D i14']EFU51152.1 hypothetical protein HMPREF9544_03804 [Escherichia coli MS 153-1]CAA0103099.1 conserved protein of unknown function [Escherichia coli]